MKDLIASIYAVCMSVLLWAPIFVPHEAKADLLVNPFVFSADGGSSLLTGLVAYWKMEEASGARVDSHGSYDLTATGSPGNTSGVIGSEANLASSSQFLSSSDSIFKPGSSDFTFSAWVQASVPVNNSILLFGAYLSTGNLRCWAVQIYNSNLVDSNQLRAFISRDGTNTAGELITVNPDPIAGFLTSSLHHVALTRDGDNFSLYLNGALLDTKTLSGALFSTTVDFRINGQADGSQAQSMTIDECGYWLRALSSAEISSLYNGGSGITYPF